MVHKQSRQSSRALILMKEIISDIDEEINAHKKGIGTNGTISQLENIRSEIEKMMSIMNAEVFAPYYPKVIVDSWDFKSKLGEKLLGLAQEYQKLD